MPRFQAFITDMDGTILPAAKPLSERTKATLRRVSRQGVSVVLCSGRSALSLSRYAREIGLAQGEMICFNGARVVDLGTGEVLARNEIDPAVGREMLAWLAARNCYAHYFAGDQWFCREECDISRQYARQTGVEPRYTHRPLEACMTEPAPKLLGIGEPGEIARLREEGEKAFAGRLNVMTSSPRLLEITSVEASKGAAVEQLCRARGWTKDDVLCAGDGLNDLSMMQWAKYGMTVANANPAVKALAWREGPACDEDGIAALLDELIPPEENRA